MRPAPPRGIKRSTRPFAVIISFALSRVVSSIKLIISFGRAFSVSASRSASTIDLAELYASFPPRRTQAFPLLNARAAALLYLYQENYSKEILDEFIEHIHIMDREGVRRLWEIVNKTTKKKILWGYEAKILETNRDLNIEANDILKKNIAEALEKGVYIREESVKGMKWPFMEGKSYEMDVEIVGVRK